MKAQGCSPPERHLNGSRFPASMYKRWRRNEILKQQNKNASKSSSNIKCGCRATQQRSNTMHQRAAAESNENKKWQHRKEHNNSSITENKKQQRNATAPNGCCTHSNFTILQFNLRLCIINQTLKCHTILRHIIFQSISHLNRKKYSMLRGIP